MKTCNCAAHGPNECVCGAWDEKYAELKAEITRLREKTETKTCASCGDPCCGCCSYCYGCNRYICPECVDKYDHVLKGQHGMKKDSE